MPKFFVNSENINDHIITLDGENAKHIGNVLRAKKGDTITVCDGEGRDYECEITEITKKTVTAKITDIFTNDNEPDIKITLYQGLPKADKMELVIQKCIEIGVDRIVPVKTEHTVVKLEGKEEKKLQRWNKIAESAAKQCGRGKIPVVDSVMSFKEAISEAASLDGAIIPYEKERENSLKTFAKGFKGKSIGIFIGPEGGFSNKEIDFALSKGVQSVTLGKRILRTETAGLVTSVILLYELED
ncbi:MAG: 16S rRNA (uracil(1498)-N(3))-methyltransferase [Clostridia bacterium]|nr:16S rRNA (uracil(1498)-N(3))-methyltransferase [Clostridia bacterium]